MLNLKSAPGRALALAAALVTVATPALGQDRFDWGGGRSGERDYRLIGAGVPLLLPELKRTPRGRAPPRRHPPAERSLAGGCRP